MKFWITVIALVAACVSAAWQWWQRDHDRWRPPAALRPEVPNIATLPSPAEAPVSTALDRPLLWTSRRPPRAPTTEDRLIEELNQSRLLAVLQSGDQRVALLRAPNGRWVKYGSDTRPWRLETFDGRQATFITEDGAQRAIRPLEPIRSR